MTTGILRDVADFLQLYDVDGTGRFDRDRWLHLCSNKRINLPQDLAEALFDRLGGDSDGHVTISELLAELTDWQERVSIDGVNKDVDFKNPTENLVLAQILQNSDEEPLSKNNFMTNGFNNEGSNSKRKCSVYGSNTENIDADFRKSLIQANQLKLCIQDSYPELAEPFQKLVDSLKYEITMKISDHEALKQIYRREKEARLEDMKRLENELDVQMQQIEDNLKNDIRRKLEAEYQEKVLQKEKEINRMQDTVNELQASFRENFRKRSTRQPPSSEKIFSILPQDLIKLQQDNNGFQTEEEDLLREAENLRKCYTDAKTHLQESKDELSKLRSQLDTQSSELHMEKLRCSNYVEEKKLLHEQVCKLRSMLIELYETGHDRLFSTEMDFNLKPLNRDSGQWSGLNDCSNHGTSVSCDVVQKPTSDQFHTPDRIFRVILVGDSAVGKTCFLHRFCTGDFYRNTRPTLGIDFKTRNVELDGKVYTIELWDTASQERFHSIVSQYFRKSDGAILMYDVSNMESFLGVRNWMSILENNSGENPIPRVLVGNKVDLREAMGHKSTKFIHRDVGAQLAKNYDAEFCETSVLSNVNVEDAIISLISQMKLKKDTTIKSINLRKSKRQLKCCTG